MLTRICSVIGVPLRMDNKTANGELADYVRVCIIIDAAKKIPEKVRVQIRDGGDIRIEVIDIFVENLPLYCMDCEVFGHKCSTGISVEVEAEIRSPEPGVTIGGD